MTRDGTKIISGDDYGEIKVWDVKSHELVNAWTQGALCPVISISPDDRLILQLVVGSWESIPRKESGSPTLSRSAAKSFPCLSLLRGTNPRVALMTTSESMTLRLARSSSLHSKAMWQLVSVACCGRAMAADCFLHQAIKRFAVGTLEEEDKPDNRGQVTPTTYTLCLFRQMERSLQARPWIKLSVSGIQLTVVPRDRIYNTTQVSTPFVSLPLVNSWHRRIGSEI